MSPRPAAFASLLGAIGLSACAGAPDLDAPWLDFSALSRPSSPNTALACDPSLCPVAEADLAPLSVSVSPEAALEAFQSLLPEAQIRREPNGDIRARYVAVTALFRFKDDVDLLIRPEETGAVIAAYSRSRVGYSDLGANKSRLETLFADWRAALVTP